MTTNNIVSQTAHVNRPRRGRLVLATSLAIVTASIANIGLYVLVSAAIPAVGAWPGAGTGQIVGATMVYLLIGAVVFAAVRRWSNRPARHYLILATVGLLVSLFLPVSAGFGYGAPGAPAASTAVVITLSLMHLVSYAISVPLYIRLGLD